MLKSLQLPTILVQVNLEPGQIAKKIKRWFRPKIKKDVATICCWMTLEAKN